MFLQSIQVERPRPNQRPADPVFDLEKILAPDSLIDDPNPPPFLAIFIDGDFQFLDDFVLENRVLGSFTHVTAVDKDQVLVTGVVRGTNSYVAMLKLSSVGDSSPHAPH